MKVLGFTFRVWALPGEGGSDEHEIQKTIDAAMKECVPITDGIFDFFQMDKMDLSTRSLFSSDMSF